MSGAVALSLSTTEGRQIASFAAGFQEFFFTNEASVTNPAKDLIAFRGSATREVIVHGIKIVLNVPADSTTLEYMFMIHRSGLGTGGVATPNFTASSLDKSQAVATASVFGWETSPQTLGPLVGVIDMEPTAGVGGTAPQDPHDARSILTVPFTIHSGLPGIYLNGVNDVLNVGFSGLGRIAVGGVAVWAAAYWSEII